MGTRSEVQVLLNGQQDKEIQKDSPIVQMNSVHKIYQTQKEHQVHALKNINLSIRKGEYVAIMGKSGSGKSTLLNLLGCLDRPTYGEYLIGGKNTALLDDNQLSSIRCRSIGFVFQSFNLIKQLTLLENIELPLFYQRVDPERARRRAIQLAEMVGLADRLYHRPNELSGGQQQRVAIARALANDPLIILADEPTGNLDSHSEKEILMIFERLHREGCTIIIVTHDEHVACYTQRLIRLHDGEIVEDRQLC